MTRSPKTRSPMKRDEEAFAEFASGIRSQLRRTAYLACGDWERASDHVQEALIRVYVAWPRLQRQGREHAYARKVLMNVVIDHVRRRSSTETPIDVSVDHHQASASGRASVPDHADQLAERSRLMAALDTLHPRQRACLVLRFFEDLSVTDTAAALSISEGTVKSQTSRALDKVRAHLSEPDLTTHTLSVTTMAASRAGAARWTT